MLLAALVEGVPVPSHSCPLGSPPHWWCSLLTQLLLHWVGGGWAVPSKGQACPSVTGWGLGEHGFLELEQLPRGFQDSVTAGFSGQAQRAEGRSGCVADAGAGLLQSWGELRLGA